MAQIESDLDWSPPRQKKCVSDLHDYLYKREQLETMERNLEILKKELEVIEGRLAASPKANDIFAKIKPLARLGG